MRQRPQRPLRLLAWPALLLLGWLTGPLPVLLVVGLLLGVPRLRDAVLEPWWSATPRERVTRVGVGALVGSAVVGLAVGPWLLAPSGRLPLPPGPGRWVTPAYEGRPLEARPLTRADAVADAGPVGDSPVVAGRWLGTGCSTMRADAAGHGLVLCRDGDITTLRVLGADDRPRASLDLPASGPCAGGLALRPDGRLAVGLGRAVTVVRTVGTGDRAIVRREARSDLTGVLAAGDCVRDVALDPRGRTWFVSARGVLGLLDGAGPPLGRLDLGAPVATGFAAPDPARPDRMEVSSQEAVVAVDVAAGPRLQEAWRSAYDLGSGPRAGQPVPGSASRPLALPGGLLAIADVAEPRSHVVVLDRASGRERCRAELFADDHSIVGADLVAVGRGASLLAVDSAGWTPWGTALGRAPHGAISRIDVRPEGDRLRCVTAWTADVPTAPVAPVVAADTGLAYVVGKRSTLWAVQAWTLTLVDLRTGARPVTLRLGLGELARPTGPLVRRDRSLHLVVRGGVVRVRDRASTTRPAG